MARLLAGETPIPTGPGPKVIFHALPLNPSNVWPTFLTLSIQDQLINVMPPMAGNPSDWRYNLDGFVVHSVRGDLSRQTYTQCYRDGGIEAMSGGIVERDPGRGGFYGHGVEITVIKALTNFQKLWRLLGLTGPMMMALTLSGVQGAKILATPDRWNDRTEAFDLDVAMLPEIVVQDASEAADRVLKPLFDLMWNGGGWPRSPWYSASGDRVQAK